MREEHVILSERPEDLKRQLSGAEQQKKMLNDRGKRMIEAVSKENLWSFDTASFLFIFLTICRELQFRERNAYTGESLLMCRWLCGIIEIHKYKILK